MRHNDLQRANLDLLLQLDRLLTEADRARALRDRLLAVARQNTLLPTAQDAPSPGGRVPGESADAEEAAAP